MARFYDPNKSFIEQAHAAQNLLEKGRGCNNMATILTDEQADEVLANSREKGKAPRFANALWNEHSELLETQKVVVLDCTEDFAGKNMAGVAQQLRTAFKAIEAAKDHVAVTSRKNGDDQTRLIVIFRA